MYTAQRKLVMAMSIRITDMKKGGNYQDVTVMLNRVQKHPFRSKAGEYLSLDFQDRSGVISGRMWDIPHDLDDLGERCTANSGLYVNLTCQAEEYQGKLQLIVKHMAVVPDESVDIRDFLPTTIHDVDDLSKELNQFIEEVRDTEYKTLLTAVFSEYASEFANGIGGIKMHHSYVGGLLEHTLQVTILAVHACDHPILFPELNRDLVITGSLLHDIGKVDEYLYRRAFAMDPTGVEHRYGGIALLERVVVSHGLSIESKKLRDLKHIIMTHHGPYGDETLRMDIPEAVVVHNSDALSGKVNGMLQDKGRLGKAGKGTAGTTDQ